MQVTMLPGRNERISITATLTWTRKNIVEELLAKRPQ